MRKKNEVLSLKPNTGHEVNKNVVAETLSTSLNATLNQLNKRLANEGEKLTEIEKKYLANC